MLRIIPGLGDDASLAFYTGNRYGSRSSTEPLIDAILSNEPWFGLGLRGVATATDTAFVQALVLGGLVGVACIATLLAALVTGYRKQRHNLEPPERHLFAGVVTIAVLLSFATPLLTGNRVAVLLWVLLGLLLVRAAGDTPDDADRERTNAIARRRGGRHGQAGGLTHVSGGLRHPGPNGPAPPS